jgi:hypothetical protein
MANPTGAFGLRPIRRQDGSPWNGGVVPCYIDSDYATALFIGDPVSLDSTQANKHAVANRGEGLMPTIIKCALTDTTVVYGVIVAFDVLTTNLAAQYNPASTARIAYVVRSPDVVFEMRGDGGATPVAFYVGCNAVGIATTTGDTVTGLSGMHLDEGTTTDPRVDLTFPLLIVGASSKPDETPLAVNTLWEVVINNHYNASGLVLGVSGT